MRVFSERMSPNRLAIAGRKVDSLGEGVKRQSSVGNTSHYGQHLGETGGFRPPKVLKCPKHSGWGWLEGRMGLALEWLWGGFGVALRWL